MGQVEDFLRRGYIALGQRTLRRQNLDRELTWERMPLEVARRDVRDGYAMSVPQLLAQRFLFGDVQSVH